MLFAIFLVDLVPCVCVAAALVFLVRRADDTEEATTRKLMLFTGVLFCRLCSLTYHLLSKTALEKRLFFLDLLGIASNAWAIPWIVSNAVNSWTRKIMGIYMMVAFLLYGVVASSCLMGMFSMDDKSHCRLRSSALYQRNIQQLILVLGCMGSFPILLGVGDGGDKKPATRHRSVHLGSKCCLFFQL